MRYTIVINQFAIVANNLDLSSEEVILLDYLYWLCKGKSKSLRRLTKENEEYTWFDYGFFTKQNPLIKAKSKASITLKIKELERKGFIKTCLSGDYIQKKYITILPKTELIYGDEEIAKKTKNTVKNAKQRTVEYSKQYTVEKTKQSLFKKLNADKEDIRDKEERDNVSNETGKPFLKKELDETIVYGREDINDVISFFTKELGASMDGSKRENRRYANLLLGRIKKDYPQKDSTELVKVLIKVGLRDSFHKNNLTGFKYLYYNMQKIIQKTKNKESERKMFINLG